MEHVKKEITVKVQVNLSPHIVWEYWTNPEHIVNWNCASDDWHTPTAVNDLQQGGWFRWRMEAKDRSAGFDFEGRYDEIVPNEKIVYTMADSRKVKILFTNVDNNTLIIETFDTENLNPADMQRAGWQAILDRFKYYVELNEK